MGLLQMSFSGAVLILAIVVIRAIAINRLPKKTFLALWIIAVIRLLLPFSVPSPFSIYSLANRTASDVEIPDTITYEYLPPVFEAVLEESQNTPAAGVPQTLPTSPSVSIRTLIWLIGMSVLAGSFLISYWKCRREFKTALPIHNDIITEWLSEHPLKRKIEIRQFSGILTPMTYGIFRPIILLPKNTDWENKQQLQYILFHEYVHIRRYDTMLKFLTAAALCIHWFNPMVWVLYFLFNRDIELACDECVIRRFGKDNRSAYARMLISMEERKNRFAPFCNNFSKNAIEERIESIMKMKKTSVVTLVLSGIIVIGTVSVFATSIQTNEPIFEEALLRQPPEKIIMYYTFDGMTSESAAEYAARNYPEIDNGYGQSSRAAALVNTVNVGIESGLTGYMDERYSEYFIHANIVQNTKEKSVLSFSGDAVPIDGEERKIVNFDLTIDWNKVIENNGNDFIEITTYLFHEETDAEGDALYPVNAHGQTYGLAKTASIEQFPDLVPALGKNGTIAYMRKEDYFRENDDKYERYTVALTGDELEDVRERYKDQYPNAAIIDFYKECYDVPLFDVDGEDVVDQFVMNVGCYPYQ